jgi:hypothetical protein
MVERGEKKSQTLRKVQDSKICDTLGCQILLSCTSPGVKPYISYSDLSKDTTFPSFSVFHSQIGLYSVCESDSAQFTYR